MHPSLPFAFVAWALLLPTPGPAWSQTAPPARAECHEWRECRTLALDAAARGDYETFHDLAWRAVQTGPKADPDLMYLLARAQSLSGRPHDALVMLQRLADLGVATDAATNDDFRRVRALPGWPEVDAAIERVKSAAAGVSPPPPPAPAPAPPPPPAPAPPRVSAPAPPPEPAAPLVSTPSAAPSAPIPPAPSESEAPAMVVEQEPVEEALRFSAEPFAPGGLAYDAVSKRFVFGDLHARRIMVVAEGRHHSDTLVSAASAGFHDVRALEIDPLRGDSLWVVSAATDGGAAALHKLQLVSGRLLATFPAPAALEPLTLGDVAVTAGGTALALDLEGRRILRLAPGSASFELAMPIDVDAPASLAPAADERVVYVAYRNGIVRLDLKTRLALPLVARPGIALDHFEWIRCYGDSLVGVQSPADGPRRIVRLALDRGGHVVISGVVIDASIAGAGPTRATISGDDLYYLVTGSGTGAGAADRAVLPGALAEVVVERIKLR